MFRGYRDEVWTALQRAMNEGGAWDGRAVRVRHPPFVVTIDVNAPCARSSPGCAGGHVGSAASRAGSAARWSSCSASGTRST